MIALSNGDKLMSMTEVLARVRDYTAGFTDRSDNIGEVMEREILILAVALDEDKEFIEGAIRPHGRLKRRSGKLPCER